MKRNQLLWVFGAIAALAMVLASPFYSSANDGSGYSLRVGTPDSTFAYVSRDLKFNARVPGSADYTYSFDYRYPEGEAMDGYYIYRPHNFADAQAADQFPVTTEDVDPYFIQHGSNVYMGFAGEESLIISDLSPDTWHQFSFRFRDSEVSVYLNGEPVALEGSLEFDRGRNTPIRNFGYMGDLTNDGIHNGYAYYDNFKWSIDGEWVNDSYIDPVTGWGSNGNISNLNMNSGDPANLKYNSSDVDSRGRWIFYDATGSHLYDDSNLIPVDFPVNYSEAGVSAPEASLASLQASIKPGIAPQSGARYRLEDVFDITAVLDNGRSAVLPAGKLDVALSDNDAGIISSEGGQTYISFLKEGSFSASFGFKLYGIQATAEDVAIQIEESAIVESLHIENSGSFVYLDEESTELLVSASFAGGHSADVSADLFGERLSVTSSDETVLETEIVNNRFLLNAKAEGESEVTVTYQPEEGQPIFVSRVFEVTTTRGGSVLTQPYSLESSSHSLGLGYFWIPYEGGDQLPDDYMVAFDYYVPSEAPMNNFTVWSSAVDGSVLSGSNQIASPLRRGPSVMQLGNKIVAGMANMSNTANIQIQNMQTVTETLSRDKWHHFLIHYKDNRLGIYIDGELSAGGYYTYEGDGVKITNLGPFGDEAWREPNTVATAASGYAYYDNLTLSDADTTYASFSFDNRSPHDDDGNQLMFADIGHIGGNGWIDNATRRGTPVFDASMNSEPVVFDSLEASPARAVYAAGLTLPLAEVLDIAGWMSDGSAAPTGAGRVAATSSNPDILSITTDEAGVPYATFHAAGRVDVEVRAELFGVERSAEASLTASADNELYQIGIANATTAIMTGESESLALRGLMSDGTSQAITLGQLRQIATDLQVASSNEEIMEVAERDDQYVITALAPGTADIMITGEVNGRVISAKAAFTAVEPESITIEPLVDRIYEGDRIVLKVTAELANGDLAYITPKAVISSGDAAIAEVVEVDGMKMLAAVAPGEVQLNASFNGLSASVEVKVAGIEVAKERSSYYTADKIATARNNIAEFAWANDEKDVAVDKAEVWLQHFSLQELWEMIPSQNIPRSYGVNQIDGGLACANEIKPYGNYPYKFSKTEVDWKLESPVCGIKFPTNDFKAYYEGGLDEYGNFDPVLAKQHNDRLIAAGEAGNLVNLISQQIAGNPAIAQYVTDEQINDPDWGVDDGMGYRFDPDDTTTYGRPHTFVAYYAHWALWYNGGMIKSALPELADAYMYTGEQKYADAALVMLDRIADLYPEMQVSQFPHSNVPGYQQYGFLPSDGWHFNPGRGKIVGSIWENEMLKEIMYAYDAVFPAIDTLGAEAAEVLNAKAHSDNKSNADRMKVNLEDGVLREAFKAYQEGDLQGNPGMHQSTLALAAVVIDHDPETSEWLNFDFRSGAADWKDHVKTGGNIMSILVDDVSHDGQGDESAPGYNALWLSNWLEVAKMLDGYELPGGGTLDGDLEADLYKNPRFRKMFMAMYPLLLTSTYTPNIGDTGKTGNPTTSTINLAELILAYDKYGEDELAQAIYLLNGNNANGISLDVFSENPNEISGRIRQVIAEKGELELGSDNLTGYGLGILRDGADHTGSMFKGIPFGFLDLQNETSEGLTVNRSYPPVAQIEPSEAGQSISFDFAFSDDSEKTYQFYLEYHAVENVWAEYQVELNGKSLGTIDFAEGPSGVHRVKLSDVQLLEGENTISFINTSAGPDGSLKMGIRYMYFLEEGMEMPDDALKRDTTQRALWMYYGGTGSHAHGDPLNLGYIGYDLDLMPDLGYPDTTNDTLAFFTKTTKSHNTVTVNGSPVDAYGKPTHFDDSGFVKLMSVDDNGVAIIKDAPDGLYKRTSAMVRVNEEDSYIVDLFHLRGGNFYDYGFHTGESDSARTVYTGLELAPATGEEVSLKNFRKDADGTTGSFSIDWNLKDTYNRYGNGSGAQTDVHMKITVLGDYDEVTVADGIPPQNSASNPDKLEYLYVRSNNSETAYASVIEPYRTSSNIESIEELAVTDNGSAANSTEVKAIKVVLKNGRTDYIVHSLNPSKTYRVADKFDFNGFFGVISEQDGRKTAVYVNDGTLIDDYTADLARVTGIVAGRTDTLAVHNYIDITLDQAIDPSRLVDRYIYIENEAKTNAIYRIAGAERRGENIRLDIGDLSVVQGWKDSSDFNTGYTFSFEPGAAFRIPLSAVRTYDGNGGEGPGQGEGDGSVYYPPVGNGDTVATADASAATLSFLSGAVRLDIEPGTFAAETRLTVRESELSGATEPLAPFGPAYEITIDGADMVKPVGLTVRYDNSILHGMDERKLGLYRQDEEQPGRWHYVGGVVSSSQSQITAIISEPGTYAVMVFSQTFADLDGHWSRSDVEVLASRHVVRGVGNGVFDPDRSVTRAEFARLAVQSLQASPLLEGEAAETDEPYFTDVTDRGLWYYRDVKLAHSLGLIAGDNGRFRPDDPISREEMVVIAVRTIDAFDSTLLPKKDVFETGFKDEEAVSGWAIASAIQANAAGLVRGDEAGYLNPKGEATRAQAAVVVLRMMSLMDQIDVQE